MELEEEKWIILENCQDRYKISNLGRAFDIQKDKEISLYDNGRKIQVGLVDYNGSKGYHYYSLRNIIASHFIENPDNYHYLKHQDNNYKNNRYDNLIWSRHNSMNIIIPTDNEWTIIQSNKDYEIHRDSRVRNVHTKKELTPQLIGNYYCISLENPHQRYGVHQLVALVYIPNPNNKPSVDHIDRDPKNNHVSNLRWADFKEQAANRKKSVKDRTKIQTKSNRTIWRLDPNTNERIESYNGIQEAVNYVVENNLSKATNKTINEEISKGISSSKIKYGYYWKFEDVINIVEGEIWKSTEEAYPTSNGYKVSSEGRMIDRYGMLMSGYTTKRGEISVTMSGVEERLFLHRIIAAVFLPNPFNYPQVNHKNGEPSDNRIENLEWCTCSKNVKHAYDNGLSSHNTKVQVINIITQEKTIFNTKKSAFTTLDIGKQTLNKYLDTGTEYKGYIFETVE